MEFTGLYPARVTPGKDGIYRWSCQVTAPGNQLARKQFWTSMLVICGSVCILAVVFAFLTHDFSFVWIPFACCGFILLLSLLILKRFMANRTDRFTVAYEMNDEAILTIRKPHALQPGSTPMITAALGIAAGHPPENYGYGNSAFSSPEASLAEFRNVRNMEEFRRESRICLQAAPAVRHIRIPAEDYDMVLEFIRMHISDPDRQWNPYC